jgi:hypothetical protein
MSVPTTAKLLCEIGSEIQLVGNKTYATKPTGNASYFGEILFGVDSLGSLHLFIPVEPQAQVLEDLNSSGVKLRRVQLDEGLDRRCFLDLVCLKPHLQASFHLLADEVLATINDSDRRPDVLVAALLKRWRDLFARESSAPLSHGELAGLFGELNFLRRIIAKDIQLMSSWTGPIGQRHDFSLSAASVEVKTSLSSQASHVYINGIEQLTPAGVPLYLLHYRLEVAQGGETVPGLVGDLIASGVDSSFLYSLLARVGYFPEHEGEYGKLSFRVVESALYLIDESAPVLSARSFKGGNLPPAVVRVTYVLDLGQLGNWRSDQDELEQLLGESLVRTRDET